MSITKRVVAIAWHSNNLTDVSLSPVSLWRSARLTDLIFSNRRATSHMRSTIRATAKLHRITTLAFQFITTVKYSRAHLKQAAATGLMLHGPEMAQQGWIPADFENSEIQDFLHIANHEHKQQSDHQRLQELAVLTNLTKVLD